MCQKQKCPCDKLDKTDPDIAAQWHPTLNGNKKPSDYTRGSREIIWWICLMFNCVANCPHIWEASIGDRTIKGNSCPLCSSTHKQFCIHNSFGMKEPNKAILWDDDNKDTPYDVSPYNSDKHKFICYNYNCPFDCPHKWESTVAHITDGRECPYCAKKKICIHNSLLWKFPDLAAQIVGFKGKYIDPSTLPVSSNKRLTWKCPNATCGHQWESAVFNRTKRNSGCPKCKIASRGEEATFKYLSSNPNVKIESTTTFPGLKSIKNDTTDSRSLKVDFHIIHNKLKNICIIEYDGELHFLHLYYQVGDKIPLNHLRGYENDRIKDEYFKKHNIHLLRIAYTDLKKVDQVVAQFFKECIEHEKENPTTSYIKFTHNELYEKTRVLVEDYVTKQSTINSTTSEAKIMSDKNDSVDEKEMSTQDEKNQNPLYSDADIKSLTEFKEECNDFKMTEIDEEKQDDPSSLYFIDQNSDSTNPKTNDKKRKEKSTLNKSKTIPLFHTKRLKIT